MAQDNEVKARMVRALRLATESAGEAGALGKGGNPLDYRQPDSYFTGLAILAVEIFKHLDSATGSPRN